MGVVLTLTTDMFLCAVGKQVTLRKETGLVYTDKYKEIDEASSTYTDTTIKILFAPRSNPRLQRTEAGFQIERDQITCFFQSTCTVEIGDLIKDGAEIWRVHNLTQETYQGLAVIKGTLEREP